MLVRLLITIANPGLAAALSISNSDSLAIDLTDAPVSIPDSRLRVDPDLILADAARLGANPGDPRFAQAIAELGGPVSGPNVIFLAGEEGPGERAAAVAAGCLAVLDSAARPAALGRAILGVVRGWRAGAIQLQDAEQPGRPTALGDFVTRSAVMAETMMIARRVCPTNSSILILGETGVGKERLARAMHDEGPRRDQPFVVINCGAIPESLIESELFGHEKGSFTGAHQAHRGHFEMAHGGTLLLDEIGELPLQFQVKLLRVIQDRKVQRIGAEYAIPVDVRLMAATNRDLREEVVTGGFRSDLFYRISVVSLTIPPLRERREDIPLMVQTYLDRYRDEVRSEIHGVSKSAMEALQNYDWPGNVREVVNVVERATLLCEQDEIGLEDLPEEIAATVPAPAVPPGLIAGGDVIAKLPEEVFEVPIRTAKRACLEAFERTYLDRLLRNTDGRINETSKRAGIDPRSLYDKMRRLGLRKEDYK